MEEFCFSPTNCWPSRLFSVFSFSGCADVTCNLQVLDTLLFLGEEAEPEMGAGNRIWRYAVAPCNIVPEVWDRLLTLQRNTDTTGENPLNHYHMRVGVSDHRCQMSIGGQVHEAQDPELVSTLAISIAFGEEGAVTGLINSTFLTSITASNFSYDQI
jgi:hypothetical protein